MEKGQRPGLAWSGRSHSGNMQSVFKGQSEKGVSRCMDRPFQIVIISPCTDRSGMDRLAMAPTGIPLVNQLANGPPKTSLALIRNCLPKRNIFHPLFHSLTNDNNKDHPRCRPSTGCTQLWRPRRWVYSSLTLSAVFQCGDKYGGHTSVKGSLSNSMGCVDVCMHDRGMGVCDYGSSSFRDGEES
jgi:hypothetical protein